VHGVDEMRVVVVVNVPSWRSEPLHWDWSRNTALATDAPTVVLLVAALPTLAHEHAQARTNMTARRGLRTRIASAFRTKN
jgi:hypothetical protein